MDITGLSLEQKIGQCLCVGFPGPEATEDFKQLIKDYHIGNIILFDRNFKNCEQLYTMLKELQQTALEHNGGIPLFVTIDQEGGFVSRVWNDATFFPGAMATSAAGKPENAYLIGKHMGEELRALGVNFNFAPVLDINTNPENPVINVRSYGDTREGVTLYAMEYMKGMQENVIATGKHFPGHGDTSLDSHLTLPTVACDMETLNELDLYPFKKAVENGIKAIMTTHILFPDIESENVPATMSETILTGILRKKMGFEGIIVTDCMEMKAISNFYGTEKGVVAAISAGADITLVCHTRQTQINAFNALKEAVKADAVLMEKLDKAVSRVVTVKSGILPEKSLDEMKIIVSNPVHKSDAARISEESLTLFRGEAKTFSADDEFFAVFFSTRAALTGVDSSRTKGDLEGDFNKFYKKAESCVLPVNPTDEQINACMDKASKHKNVVIFSYNAAQSPKQAEAINRLLDKNPDALVISMRSPYDIRRFNQVKNYVMAYEYTPPAIAAVLKFLRGGLEPSGKAPVDVLKGM